MGDIDTIWFVAGEDECCALVESIELVLRLAFASFARRFTKAFARDTAAPVLRCRALQQRELLHT